VIAGSSVSAVERPAAGAGAGLPAFRVSRSTRLHLFVLVVSVLIVVGLASVPVWAQVSVTRTLITLFGLVALAQMWNLLAGFAGLISVGQQAYIGIGAYGLWLFGDKLHFQAFVAAVLAAALAALIALCIAPLLFRLRGGYFAIGSWVFAVIVMLIVSNDQATGGGSGTTLMSVALLPRDTRIFGTYWMGLAVAVGSVLVVYLLLRSKRGLALTAIRDDTLAAQSSGVNVFRSKLIAYVIAAFGCAAMGAVVALNLLFIQPASSFSINWTAYAIVIVVIGGLGSIEGPILGAIIYFALQQTLSQYGSTYFLLLGVIAVLMATKVPRGLWGLVAARWDLHLFPVRRGLVLESPPKAPPKVPPTTESPVPAGQATS
jgi:branched-chain amino acid transport system permease protein